MPRFFFSCEGALDFTDHIGTELPDIAAAREEAIRMAGEVIKDHPGSFAESPNWTMTVSSETGEDVFILRFSLEEKARRPNSN